MSEFKILDAKIEALGSSASDEQQDNLVDWVVHNIGKDYWVGVLDVFCGWGLNTAITLLSERLGEVGVY